MIPTKELNECHNIDIIELRDYVDKFVQVTTKSGKSFEGVMYTVDPVSGCVILVKAGNKSFDFIFGHAVDQITVIKHERENVAFFDNPSRTSESDDNVKKRLGKLKSWLLQNRIPVVEVGDELKLGDVLTIIPPYSVDSVLSTNEIVLANVQRLMQNMPNE